MTRRYRTWLWAVALPAGLMALGCSGSPSPSGGAKVSPRTAIPGKDSSVTTSEPAKGADADQKADPGKDKEKDKAKDVFKTGEREIG